MGKLRPREKSFFKYTELETGRVVAEMQVAANRPYCGDHFAVSTNIKSLGCTRETNIMVYVNYISNKERQVVGLPIQSSFQPLPSGSEDMKFIHGSLSLSKLAPPWPWALLPGPHKGLLPL